MSIVEKSGEALLEIAKMRVFRKGLLIFLVCCAHISGLERKPLIYTLKR